MKKRSICNYACSSQAFVFIHDVHPINDTHDIKDTDDIKEGDVQASIINTCNALCSKKGTHTRTKGLLINGIRDTGNGKLVAFGFTITGRTKHGLVATRVTSALLFGVLSSRSCVVVS